MDAQKLGDEIIRCAMPGAEGHEREVGDILHRREREHGRFEANGRSLKVGGHALIRER
ncbi:MAG: hypothetical protein RIQ79_326 [Verrucomicrobiota bacterium]